MTQDLFQQGEIVWAKVSGHPWWPALVAEVDSNTKQGIRQAAVNFIGENSHASLPFTKLAPYKYLYHKHSIPTHTRLSYSIMMANKILAKETTFERKLMDYL
jgi:hypothetical protein